MTRPRLPCQCGAVSLAAEQVCSSCRRPLPQLSVLKWRSVLDEMAGAVEELGWSAQVLARGALTFTRSSRGSIYRETCVHLPPAAAGPLTLAAADLHDSIFPLTTMPRSRYFHGYVGAFLDFVLAMEVTHNRSTTLEEVEVYAVTLHRDGRCAIVLGAMEVCVDYATGDSAGSGCVAGGAVFVEKNIGCTLEKQRDFYSLAEKGMEVTPLWLREDPRRLCWNMSALPPMRTSSPSAVTDTLESAAKLISTPSHFMLSRGVRQMEEERLATAIARGRSASLP